MPPFTPARYPVFDVDDRAGGVSPSTRPAPGKRAPTDHLRPMTGIPLVDQGPLCEQRMSAGNDNCTLTHDERVWLIHTLSVNVQIAMANFRDAIQDARIDKLTSSGAGWGFLEEFLFMTATGPLVGRAVMSAEVILGRAAAKLAETNLDALTLKIAKIDRDAIRGAVTNASKGLRSQLKHARLSMPEGNFGKAAFLAKIREGIGPMTRALLAVMPTVLDDSSLIAMTLAYGDESLHGVAAYAQMIAEVIASFDDNRIDDVGQTTAHGKRVGQDGDVEEVERGRLVWVTKDNGSRKLALFAGKNGGNDFVRWVDPQWHQLAVGLYRDRRDKEPDTMTMDGFNSSVSIGAAVERENASAWLDSLLRGPL